MTKIFLFGIIKLKILQVVNCYYVIEILQIFKGYSKKKIHKKKKKIPTFALIFFIYNHVKVQFKKIYFFF